MIPSAGGLYPLELYIIAYNVESVPASVFHYDVRGHRLDEVRSSQRVELSKILFVNEIVETAAAVFVVSAVFGRTKIKYGERAYRFALLEAGHAVQNICLAARGFGVGTCAVGGFVDDEINDLIEVDGVEEATLCLVSAGWPI